MLAVSDFHDTHDQNIILDFVEHPEDSILLKSVIIGSGTLSRLCRRRIVGKGSNGCKNEVFLTCACYGLFFSPEMGGYAMACTGKSPCLTFTRVSPGEPIVVPRWL